MHWAGRVEARQPAIHPANTPMKCLANCLLALAILSQAEAQPNLVVIMADDLGWRDLHGYGNEGVETPFLDQLAAEGMKFTNAYAAAPVCSPTRAAMMTGQSPARLRLTNHAPGHPPLFSLPGSDLQEAEWVRHLAADHVTLAERLSAAGYATAHIGKWHLSHVEPKNRGTLPERALYPDRQGFDLNIGGNSAGGPRSHFSPYQNPDLPDGAPGEYLPERLADEAIAYVRQQRDRPFFLNWWTYCVHYPLEATPERIAKYRRRQGVKDPVYAAMIEGMDAAIGRFLTALDQAGLRDNTVVLFKSDNGGYNGDNRPLRGFKGTLYEGGIRVPWIVRWPGRVRPGSVCTTPVISMDCFPTLLEMAGLPPPTDPPPDGRSLLPLLEEKGGWDRDALYFHYPNYAFHQKNRLGSALREGDWKLIHYYDTDEVELYRLSTDIGERQNLASRFAGEAQRLKGKLAAWLIETGASLPGRKTPGK